MSAGGQGCIGMGRNRSALHKHEQLVGALKKIRARQPLRLCKMQAFETQASFINASHALLQLVACSVALQAPQIIDSGFEIVDIGAP